MLAKQKRQCKAADTPKIVGGTLGLQKVLTNLLFINKGKIQQVPLFRSEAHCLLTHAMVHTAGAVALKRIVKAATDTNLAVRIFSTIERPDAHIHYAGQAPVRAFVAA